MCVMKRRGFTILEIIVSISILLLLAGIALPYAWGWLGRHELDAGEDQLTMQLIMARAAAREEGKPVELVARERADGSATLEARFLDVSGDAEGRDELAETDEGADGEACIEASWARWTLPSGMTLDIQLASSGDESEEDFAEDEADSSTVVGMGFPIRLVALFLPDGSALIAPTLILATRNGSERSIAIDPVTGRPRRSVPERVDEDGDRPEFEPVLSENPAEGE